MHKKIWRRMAFVLFLLALIAGVVALFRLRGSEFRWDLFAGTLVQLDLAWLSAALVLVYLTYFGRALRWRVLLRPLRPHPKFLDLLIATIIGFTAIVLFGRPGELVRPYLIAAKEKVPFSSQLAAWLLERIYDLLIVMLLFGFALASYDHKTALAGDMGPAIRFVFHVGGPVVATACLACLLVLVISSLYLPFVSRRISEALEVLPASWHKRVHTFIDSFVTGMQSTRNPGSVFAIVFYTIAEWLIIVASTYCLLRSVPATSGLRWLDSLVIVGFIAFGSIVQIPGVGGGAQIATTVVLTELYGLPLEVSTGIAVLMWIVTFVSIVPLGLGLAAHEGLNWSKLRHIEVKEVK
jgi:uncharacterized protein (TIRG00374 family)